MSFGSNSVLRGIELTVRRGELVAIVGNSGCGKTVLLKLIVGHFAPVSGRVMVADHESEGSPLRDLSTLSGDEFDKIRVHWAFVFQKNALLNGSVYYNLALWPREIKGLSDEQLIPMARRALEAVELDPDEVLELSREDLSGGMAKRVAIARALVMDPVLVMYDEPTAGLDPDLSGKIHALINRLHKAPASLGLPRTSILVTHDTELLRTLRPRVVMLADGRVLFDGTFEQFAASSDPHIMPYLRQMPILHSRVQAPD